MQGNKLLGPLYQGLLAEIEAEGQSAEASLDPDRRRAGAGERTGEHWTDAFLHRIRGEILLKRDPANTAPAEEAFLTAIAIAQQQKARSFELRAALSLAKLYQSDRPRRRRPCRARARARRLFADAGISGDRGSANAARRARRNRRSEERRRVAPAPAEIADQLRPGDAACARLSARRRPRPPSLAPASWPPASKIPPSASRSITACGPAVSCAASLAATREIAEVMLREVEGAAGSPEAAAPRFASTVTHIGLPGISSTARAAAGTRARHVRSANGIAISSFVSPRMSASP